MPKLSKPQLAALAASIAVAFGAGVLVPGGKPDAPLPTPQRVEVPLDVAKYHQQVRAYRDQHPDVVDLLTGTVPPGEQATAGVNVALGKRPGDVQAVGGSWTIDSVTFEDHPAPSDAGVGSTRIDVKVTNASTTPARFVGIVEVP